MQFPKFLSGVGARLAGFYRGQAGLDRRQISVEVVAASSLSPPPLPKSPAKAVARPGYVKDVKPSENALQRPTTENYASTVRSDAVLAMSTLSGQIRLLMKQSPNIGGSSSTTLRVGIPEFFTLMARNTETGEFDVEATRTAHQLLRRLTFLGSADGSYGAQEGIQSLSEKFAIELLSEGACAAEVALDRLRVPASINPVNISSLIAYEEENSIRFVQKVGDKEIDLDIPTFIYVAWDQHLDSAYPIPYLGAAVQSVLFDLDLDDITRRVARRNMLPRLQATLDLAKAKAMASPEILNNPQAYLDYLESLRSGVVASIESANPEDAFVSWDLVTYSYVQNTGHDPSEIIAQMRDVVNAQLATGAKTMPVALGHSNNSNSASAESLLFLKQADGLRRKLNELYSRVFTVAVRLLGHEAYCEFRYDPPDLRPDAELAAYKTMKNAAILDQLSLGLITDEEASILMTGHLPPPNYKPLAGTMFRGGLVGSQPAVENPASGTSVMNKEQAPQSPAGSQKKKA